jgi:DNA gyrase inhibitor GyrI
MVESLHVRIERLEPARVAWVHAHGPNPEEDCWSRLRAWADGQGLLSQPSNHPVFGFNNPPVAEVGTEHGYEMWMVIDAGAREAAGVGFKDFVGGLYAVTQCALAGGQGVPATWKALLRWVHTSQYAWRRDTHELERVLDPLAAEQDVVLDLYLPIQG